IFLQEAGQSPVAEIRRAASKLLLGVIRKPDEEVGEIHSGAGYRTSLRIELAGKCTAEIEKSASQWIGMAIVLLFAKLHAVTQCVLAENLRDVVAKAELLGACDRRNGIVESREIREAD